MQEYRDIENRDIWEYRLNFGEPQIRRLLLHAWELGNASFDYFFFKENCSYHLLSLLEYADPSLHLTDKFRFWTIPADTVRLLADQPGLVTDTAFRPSRVTLIRRKREQLTAAEHGLVKRLVRDAAVAQSDDVRSLPLSRQAFVLDVASDYVRYTGERDESQATAARDHNRRLLTARSLLRIPSEDLSILPFAMQPESGHKTSRASLGEAGAITIPSKNSVCGPPIMTCLIRNLVTRRMRRSRSARSVCVTTTGPIRAGSSGRPC